ncbi:MAG: hypothetical protein ACOCY7_01180 [Halodesulfurarchaeum sp.]
MDPDREKLFGGLAILGGVLSVIVSVPSSWYGLRPRDSYVFDPQPLSPMWIERELVPVLTVIAIVALLIGLLGLVVRDWSTFGRVRRWGGVGSILGLGGLTVAVPVILYASRGRPGVGAIVVLGAFAGGVISALFLALGLLLLGYGYRAQHRERIGYAFLGVLVVVSVLGFFAPSPYDSLLASLPVAIAWVIVGHDLWNNPGT